MGNLGGEGRVRRRRTEGKVEEERTEEIIKKAIIINVSEHFHVLLWTFIIVNVCCHDKGLGLVALF